MDQAHETLVVLSSGQKELMLVGLEMEGDRLAGSWGGSG